jgi:glutathione S-transferase
MSQSAEKKLVLFYSPMSRARVAHWMLEELGVPYELKTMDLFSRENKTETFLSLNPMGKIPTLLHGDLVVTECAAICTYLADAFPEARLAPPITDPARGTYLRWLFFAAGPLEQATTDKAFPRAQEVKASMIGYGTYESTVKTVESAVSKGPFILGNQFSAADLYLAAQIGWGMFTKTIEPRPAFTSYVARCEERPAFQRSFKHAMTLIEAAQKK